MGALSSPRFVNRLLWASALVLFAGILTFVVVVFGENKAPTTAAEAAGEAPAVTQTGPRKTVPLDPKARTTAGRWILSAVTREDLAEGWTLAHPDLKAECGCSRNEWMTGNIPIQPYPARDLDDASFAINESYADEVVLEVALLPREGAETESQIFWLGMKKVGDGSAARWLVTYWAPRAILPLPVAE